MDLPGLFMLQFMMIAEMTVGYFVCKKKILQPSERSVLSKLVVQVFLPCSIVNAFQMEMNASILSDFIAIFLVSCGIQVLCSFIANFGYRKVETEKGKYYSMLQFVQMPVFWVMLLSVIL